MKVMLRIILSICLRFLNKLNHMFVMRVFFVSSGLIVWQADRSASLIEEGLFLRFTYLLLMPLLFANPKTGIRWRPYHLECTGSLSTSEVKRDRARLVLGWGTAWENLRVLSAFVKASSAPGYFGSSWPRDPRLEAPCDGPCIKRKCSTCWVAVA